MCDWMLLAIGYSDEFRRDMLFVLVPAFFSSI